MRSTYTPAAGLAALILWLAGCAATSYNLPPVTDRADGEYRPGKFIWHDLISDDVEGSARFYGELFGWQFRELPLLGASYRLITLNGEAIGGLVDQKPIPAQRDISQWVSVVSSGDIDASTRRLRDAGGTVLREPVSLGDRGRIAVFTDPQGTLFAALESQGGDAPDTAELPPAGGFLWHELWAADPVPAAEFYAAFSSLDKETLAAHDPGGEPVDYHLLRAGTAPRAGVRATPVPEAPPLWMPYLRMRSPEQLDEVLGRVPALGGEVLVPAIARPAGGYMAVIAGPSGAPVALQTWADDRDAPGTAALQGDQR